MLNIFGITRFTSTATFSPLTFLEAILTAISVGSGNVGGKHVGFADVGTETLKQSFDEVEL